MEPRPSSSRSSSSSSSISSSAYRTPVAPKNIARLVKPTTTLGAPININTEDFKVPSLPNRPSRIPLKMAHPINLDLNIASRDESVPGATPSRLKRLSLLARSPTLESDQHLSTRSVTSPLFDENVKHYDSPTGRARTSTDGSSTSLGTPRRTGMGIRSSISYSPASSTSRTPTQDGFGGRSISSEARISVDSSEGRDLMGLMEGDEEEEGVKGETLTERHAELLTAIAQKERRVNELKQELETEQAALLNLKSRWSSLISAVYPSSYPTPMASSSSRDRPATIPTDSITSSFDSVSESPEDQPGFQSLLHDVLGGAPLVDPEVLEGGRRFIGNLMKTVGAAAGGTVPDGKELKEAPSNGIDLSSFGKMFSWGSSQPSNTVRIRPSDSGGSIKGRRSPAASPSISPIESGALPGRTNHTNKGSYRDLLDD